MEGKWAACYEPVSVDPRPYHVGDSAGGSLTPKDAVE